MTYFNPSRSGYVYCVRRAGKTHYKLCGAAAGQLAIQLQAMANEDENPARLVLLGWVEVQDYELAAQSIRDTFHLYQLQNPKVDHWFDFRVGRSKHLKSLLGSYANLMVKWPVTERLIDQEPQPNYDRTFGFFEALDQANGSGYFPNHDVLPIDVFPTLNSEGKLNPIVLNPIVRTTVVHWIEKIQTIPIWIYGMGAIAISLVAMSRMALQPIQQPTAAIVLKTVSTTVPTAVPTTVPTAVPTRKSEPVKSELIALPIVKKPASAKLTTPKPASKTEATSEQSTPIPPEAPEPDNDARTSVWSGSSEGATIRTSPGGSAIDFIPNGTSLVLGETSGDWQEVILPDGQRGWVFNDLVN